MKNVLRFGLVLACLAVSIACTQNKEENVLKGEQALIQGDYSQAEIFFKNAIESFPEDNALRMALGDSYYYQGKFEAAVKEYAVGSKDQVIDISYLDKFFDAIYITNDIEQLEEQLEQLKSKVDDATLSKLSYKSALLIFKFGDAERAKQLLAYAVQHAPNDAIKLLNQTFLDVLFSDQPIEEKANEIRSLYEQFPDDWLLSLVEANFAQVSGNDAVAIEIYKTLASKFPEFYELKMLIVELSFRFEEYDSAFPILERLKSRFPNQPYVNHMLGHYYLQKGELDKAKDFTDQALAWGTPNDQLLITAALVNFQLNNYEQVRYQLSRVSPETKALPFIERLSIANDFQLGEISGAADSVLSSSDNDLIAAAALSSLRVGNTVTAKALIDRVDLDELNESGQFNMSVAKLVTGDEDNISDVRLLANRVLSSSNSSDAEIQKARSLLVASYMANRNFDEGLSNIEQWISEAPDNIENYILKIALFEAQGLPVEEAMAVYNEAFKVNSESERLLSHFADFTFKKKMYAEAADAFESLIKEGVPERKNVLGYFIASHFSGNSNSVLAKIEEKLIDSSDPYSHTLLAEVYLAADRPKQAIDHILEKVVKDGSQPLAASRVLGNSYYQLRNYNKAIEFFELVLKSELETRILDRLFGSYMALNRPRDLERVLLDLKPLYPAERQIQLFLADVYLENKEPEKAQLALYEYEGSESDPVYMGLLGRVQFAAQAFEEAQKSLTIAYTSQPTFKVANTLYQAKIFNEGKNSALQWLFNHTVEQPQDVRSALIVANELATESPDKSLGLYEKILQYDERNFIALNNSAWLLMEKEQFSEALERINTALDLYPGNESLTSTATEIKTRMGR